MNDAGFLELSSSKSLILLIVFAISVQVLLTLEYGSLQIRISASDPVLIGAIMFLLINYRHRIIATSMWKVSGLLRAYMILTLILVIALVTGRLELGYWSNWALLNKFVGWFVLGAYCLVGTILMNQCSQKQLSTVFWYLLLFAGISAVYAITSFWLTRFGIMVLVPEGANPHRFNGFAANPNSFAIMLAAISSSYLILIDRSKAADVVPLIAISACVCAIVLSGSISGLLALGAGFSFALFGRWVRLKDLFLIAFGSAVLLIGVTLVPDLMTALLRVEQETQTDLTSLYLTEKLIGENSIAGHRASNILSALELWRSQPFE